MPAPWLSIPEPAPLQGLLSLQGRTAVVTGGSRGIGEAVVLRLVEAGANVVITGRGRQALQQVIDRVTAAGGSAALVQADAGRVEDIETIIDTALERFGGVDILVNNAAVFQRCLSVEMTSELWNDTIDTDLKGAFFTAQAAAKAMIAAGRGGRIVNLLSNEAFQPSGVLPAYGAAKAGLLAITRSLAKEFAEHAILVNAVTPGATMTVERIDALQGGDMASFQLAPGAVQTRQKMQAMFAGADPAAVFTQMPLGRPGFPDDIAKAVLFLVSDLADYISGACLTVDGAQTLR